jgi:hypothetical protein
LNCLKYASKTKNKTLKNVFLYRAFATFGSLKLGFSDISFAKTTFGLVDILS